MCTENFCLDRQPVIPGMGKKDIDTWDWNFPPRESNIFWQCWISTREGLSWNVQKGDQCHHLATPRKSYKVQPKDAGFGKQMKAKIGKAMEKWLEEDENLDMWVIFSWFLGIFRKELFFLKDRLNWGKYEVLKIWWIWKIDIWSEELVDGHQTVPYQPKLSFWGLSCLLVFSTHFNPNDFLLKLPQISLPFICTPALIKLSKIK